MNDRANIEHRFVDIGGLDIHVETRGRGKPLFFVHGLYMSTRMWDWLAPFLEDAYRLIMMDMRGMGQSHDKDEPYTMFADIRTVFDRLELERAHVFGLSAGGCAALEFAASNPGRVDKLVLSAPGFPPEGDLEQINAGLLAQDKEGREHPAQTAEMLTRAWLDGPSEPERVPEPLHTQVKDIISHSLSRPPIARMPDWLQPSVALRLEQLEMPILSMAGDKDIPDCLDIVRAIAGRAPRAKTEIVPGSAHFLPIEKPETVARLVRDFLG